MMVSWRLCSRRLGDGRFRSSSSGFFLLPSFRGAAWCIWAIDDYFSPNVCTCWCRSYIFHFFYIYTYLGSLRAELNQQHILGFNHLPITGGINFSWPEYIPFSTYLPPGELYRLWSKNHENCIYRHLVVPHDMVPHILIPSGKLGKI